MTKFYTSNFQAARITRPNDKFKAGELTGKVRVLMGQVVVPDTLAIGDTIELGDIPANSRIIGGRILINKSLGATGILALANGDSLDSEGNAIALSNTGITAVADAGGQAAFAQNGAAQTIVTKRLGADTRVFAHCSEAVDGNVSDAIADFVVYYVND
jgi:hypothetical protein